jgi:hypothetical protein
MLDSIHGGIFPKPLLPVIFMSMHVAGNLIVSVLRHESYPYRAASFAAWLNQSEEELS